MKTTKQILNKINKDIKFYKKELNIKNTYENSFDILYSYEYSLDTLKDLKRFITSKTK